MAKTYVYLPPGYDPTKNVKPPRQNSLAPLISCGVMLLLAVAVCGGVFFFIATNQTQAVEPTVYLIETSTSTPTTTPTLDDWSATGTAVHWLTYTPTGTNTPTITPTASDTPDPVLYSSGNPVTPEWAITVDHLRYMLTITNMPTATITPTATPTPRPNPVRYSSGSSAQSQQPQIVEVTRVEIQQQIIVITATPRPPTRTPQPTVTPVTPTVTPVTPTVTPVTPTVIPVTPTVEPETPTVEPETPTVEPETPTVEPETTQDIP